MGIEKKTVSTRLDDDIIITLEQMAKEQNRSMSNLLETIVKEYLRRELNQ